jgi:hypothetical protein
MGRAICARSTCRKAITTVEIREKNTEKNRKEREMEREERVIGKEKERKHEEWKKSYTRTFFPSSLFLFFFFLLGRPVIGDDVIT